jgi:hypothetical protein
MVQGADIWVKIFLPILPLKWALKCLQTAVTTTQISEKNVTHLRIWQLKPSICSDSTLWFEVLRPMMIMVFVTFKQMYSWEWKWLSSYTPSYFFESRSIFWLPWQQHSNNNCSHNGDVYPKTFLDKARTLTFNIEGQRDHIK